MLELFHSTSQPKNTNRYCPATICFYPPIVYLYFTPYSAGGPTSKLLRTDLIESIKTDLIDLIEALPGWFDRPAQGLDDLAFYNFQLVLSTIAACMAIWLYG